MDDIKILVEALEKAIHEADEWYDDAYGKICPNLYNERKVLDKYKKILNK
jgi:hypothetical protein